MVPDMRSKVARLSLGTYRYAGHIEGIRLPRQQFYIAVGGKAHDLKPARHAAHDVKRLRTDRTR